MKNWKKVFSLVIATSFLMVSCNLVPPAQTATPTLVPTLTPIPTFTPTDTLTPTLTPTPVVVQIEIRTPLEREKVEMITSVSGTSQNVPKDSVIWVVVFLPVVQRYFPMNDPAVLQVSGEWTSQAYVGQQGESGLEADILVVLADRDAQDAFNAYLTEAISMNNFPGMKRLPESAQLFDRVTVTRK